MSGENGGQKMISFRGVSKSFDGGATYAVKDLSLDIGEGEFVFLVGPSGCGKTTTLKMVNRLVEATSGTIEVDGRDISRQDPVELRRNIGYVIQSIGLMPHHTIEENIATVPKLLGWDRERVSERVEELATLLELSSDLLRRFPRELSGGQRQRVGVARALAVDPPVMLMDEPFGAVDPIVRGRLQEEFLELQERLRKTIVFVTHDIDEAIKMADRIAILNVGGRLEQYASPQEILRDPSNAFVEDFVGPERGLKRLSLMKVSDIKIEDGPVVSPSSTVSEAIEEMERFDFDWTSVVEGDRLLGWVDRQILANHQKVSEAKPKRFVAHVTPESSLRQALDSVVRSHTNVAVVLEEGQRYLGILTQEHISKEIVA